MLPSYRQVAPSRPPGSFCTGPCEVRAQPLPRRRRRLATRHSRGHPKRLRKEMARFTYFGGAQMGESQRRSGAARTPEGGRLNGLGVPFKSRGRTQEPIAALDLRPGSRTGERRARPQPGSCAQVALPACGVRRYRAPRGRGPPASDAPPRTLPCPPELFPVISRGGRGLSPERRRGGTPVRD